MVSEMNQIENSYPVLNKQQLQDSLGFLVNGLARLMRTALEEKLHKVGLSPTTWTVIMALGEEDGLSQTDLSKRTFLDGATITRALDQLTESNYIERHRDNTDRRVQIVVLTKEGRKAYRRVVRYGREVNDAATVDLTLKTRKQFETNIRHLIGSMRDHLNNGDS